MGCTNVKRRTALGPSSVEKHFYNLHVSKDNVKQIITLNSCVLVFVLKKKKKLIKSDLFHILLHQCDSLLVILSRPAFI